MLFATAAVCFSAVCLTYVSRCCLQSSEGSSLPQLLKRPLYTCWIHTILLSIAQAAVPKFMQLKLAPASGSTLAPGGRISQRISVTNSMHGQKPLVMRLRISYSTPSGGPTVQQAEVKNFPAGL